MNSKYDDQNEASIIVQDLSLFRLPQGFRGRNAFICQFWWIVQDTIFRWSPQSAYGFRRWLLRLFGAKIGKNVLIRQTVKTTYPWRLTIGDFSWIGDDVHLYTLGDIVIGSSVCVSQDVYLCTGTRDSAKIDFPILANPIVIDDQAWVSADSFIMPGVRIGKGAIVGARSLVTTDVPPLMVAAGSPAKVIRQRKTEARIVGKTAT
jgi:putative colanic acid biosynthesis acetyltransferase WcaF